jgi:hypothetical protein
MVVRLILSIGIFLPMLWNFWCRKDLTSLAIVLDILVHPYHSPRALTCDERARVPFLLVLGKSLVHHVQQYPHLRRGVVNLSQYIPE